MRLLVCARRAPAAGSAPPQPQPTPTQLAPLPAALPNLHAALQHVDGRADGRTVYGQRDRCKLLH